MQTVSFSEHLHTYCVRKTHYWHCCSIGDGLSPRAFDLYKFNYNLYVRLRHRIVQQDIADVVTDQ